MHSQTDWYTMPVVEIFAVAEAEKPSAEYQQR